MRWFLVPVIAILAFTGIGCTPDKPAPSPEPSVTAPEPFFASDTEAFEAAREVYVEYSRVADTILIEGVEPERIEPYVTGDYLKASLEGFASIRERGLRVTGETVLTSITLQRFDTISTGPSVVVLYVCEDISAVDYVGADGVSIVLPTRPNISRFVVVFDRLPDGSLKISSREGWSQTC